MLQIQSPGRKQTARNEDFIRLWENIDKIVSLDQIECLVSEAVMEIRATVRDAKVGYAWSGGKDSIALQVICELAGIHLSVIGLSKEIEYPHYLNWININKPSGCVVWDANIGYDWLIRHPYMIFPTNSNDLAKWYSLIQHRAQFDFYNESGLDFILLGRRNQDGNYTGGCGQKMYTDKNEVTRYSPIAQWKHEHVLGVCHYFKKRNIPPIYSDPEGWINGTGVWPVQTSIHGRNHSWELLYQISPETVLKASNYLPEAQQFLQKHGETAENHS